MTSRGLAALAYRQAFFNDTATTEIYTLSLHDALPICGAGGNRTRVRKSSTERSTYLVQSFDLTGATRTNTLRDDESLGVNPGRRDTGRSDPI